MSRVSIYQPTLVGMGYFFLGNFQYAALAILMLFYVIIILLDPCACVARVTHCQDFAMLQAGLSCIYSQNMFSY